MSINFSALSSKAFLSPMAGVTDVAFRSLAKSYGAGMTYTEFLSSAAIVRRSRATEGMLKTASNEKPVAVQLFGSSEDEIVEAAKLVQGKFDIIDINCGCPAWKVIRTGAGSAMLKKPEEIGKFVSRIASSVSRPVTVKIRSGIDAKHINAVEVAKIIEDAGASAVAVHGRTQEQGYSGFADWEIIKKVKESVNIPVIGNGDVFTPEQFKERLESSGVDAIMLARGAMGNPFVFRQIKDFLDTGKYSMKKGIEQFFEYLKLAEKFSIDVETIKAHAMSFSKGLKNGAALRNSLGRCQSEGEIKEKIESFD
ncbi:tRNA dihydrouridine synthase DusB [Candidatus Woesearchaeota archaeon]|nr:tRNA dihydrouridine synthase DusB [Candidatus Woesearchaeota archaeon]